MSTPREKAIERASRFYDEHGTSPGAVYQEIVDTYTRELELADKLEAAETRLMAHRITIEELLAERKTST